ncbi:hypothetical protein FB558_8556 [Pseudonocardia kunmingensis]|uniref:Uncharacterized protein n=1 Tax=Pseudonocardia kunmingensis TaxID=630975 RepID=A0A543CX20_9PSEU|nr:hypothetical protein FB558_8556 [Pseudonocardia kunmingensis]
MATQHRRHRDRQGWPILIIVAIVLAGLIALLIVC